MIFLGVKTSSIIERESTSVSSCTSSIVMGKHTSVLDTLGAIVTRTVVESKSIPKPSEVQEIQHKH